MTLSFGICFIAGLVSFFSPCVLSIVPGYVGLLSNKKTVLENKKLSSRKTIVNGILFIFGFSLIFIFMGLTATIIGNFLINYKKYLSVIGGIIIFIFGTHISGILNLRFLNMEFRINSENRSEVNFISSFFMGIIFSIGWSPCIGPILGSILTSIAINQLSIFHGALSLASYSLGLGLPFIAAAAGVGWVNRIFNKYKKTTGYLQIISGLIIALTGILIVFGLFERLNQFKSFFRIG
jgi:cytochrome c-type biogenesis protein